MAERVCLFTRVDSGKPIKTSLSSLVLQKYENKNVCVANVDDITLSKFKTTEIVHQGSKFEIWKSKFNLTDIFLVKFKHNLPEFEQNNIIVDFWKDNSFYVFTHDMFYLEENFVEHAVRTIKKYSPHIGMVYGDIITQGVKQYLPPFDRASLMMDYGPYVVPVEIISQIKFNEENIADRITQKYLGYHEPRMISRIN